MSKKTDQPQLTKGLKRKFDDAFGEASTNTVSSNDKGRKFTVIGNPHEKKISEGIYFLSSEDYEWSDNLIDEYGWDDSQETLAAIDAAIEKSDRGQSDVRVNCDESEESE